jgi:hypothetical protein
LEREENCMEIYKLFITKKNIPKISEKYFISKDKHVFGVNIYPETYYDFMRNNYDIFSKNRIKQHIMTDYKFLQLLKISKQLNVIVADIVTKQDSELRQGKSEEYFELQNALKQKDISEAYEILNELVNQGIEILRFNCIIKVNEREELLNINSNGTISFSVNIENIDDLFKNSKLIDFIVKGFGVLV